MMILCKKIYDRKSLSISTFLKKHFEMLSFFLIGGAVRMTQGY